MITHETYRDATGKWLAPEEIEKRDGLVFSRGSNAPVTLGPPEDVEVEERGAARRDRRDLRRRLRALVPDVGFAARARQSEWTQSGVDRAAVWCSASGGC